MIALRAENLCFSYDGKRDLLKGVHLTVEQGECVVLNGLSGCGKTTLCYILCGIIPNVISGRLGGKVAWMDREMQGKKLGEWGAQIAMVFQNPDDQLICTTVEDELAFGLENLCVPPEEIRRRVDESMERFGLSAWALRDPQTLSGGQKKLLTVACVLIQKPELLILDEPMCGLDEDGRALLGGVIDELKAEGITLLVVEHDLALAGYADRVVYLRDGEIYDRIS